MTARAVVLGSKKGEDGRISEKVTSLYRRCHDRLALAVHWSIPVDCPYTVAHTESIVALSTCMFAKSTEVFMTNITVASIKRGIDGRYGVRVRNLVDY